MEYDQFFKTLLAAFWEDFLELFWPDVLAEYHPEPQEFLKLELPAHATDSTHRRIDLAVRLTARDPAKPDLIVHGEVQAEYETDFGRRMLQYDVLLNLHHALPVAGSVLYLARRGTGIDAEDYVTEAFGTRTEHRYRRISPPVLRAADYLGREVPLGWGLAALMEPGEISRAVLKLRCLQRIAAAELDDYHRLLLVNCVKTYPALRPEEQAEYDALLAMEEYQMISNLETTWADQFIAQGREQGEAWGEARGLRRTLLKQLQVKFGDLPRSVPEQVQGIASVEQLDALLERLLTADSLAELGLDGYREAAPAARKA
jgi:hypothetical protein